MSLRRAFLVYTLGRVGLFVVVALLVWSGFGLTGTSINGMPLLLISLIGSSVLALVLLRDQRDRFGQALADKRAQKAAEVAARQARLGND